MMYGKEREQLSKNFEADYGADKMKRKWKSEVVDGIEKGKRGRNDGIMTRYFGIHDQA